MLTREQQKEKYEKDKRYLLDDDNLDQSNQNRYSLRNNFGLYFEHRKTYEIINLLNKNKLSLKDKKIIVKAEKNFVKFLELFKDKFKDILGLELEVLEEKKEAENTLGKIDNEITSG